VRLLGVERQDLERDVGSGTSERRRRCGRRASSAPAAGGCRSASVLASSPRTTTIGSRKRPIFSIDAHQPLDVRVRRIALVRRRLDAIDGQRAEQQRRAAERIAVARQDSALIAFELLRDTVEVGAAGVSGFRRRSARPRQAQSSCGGRVSCEAACRNDTCPSVRPSSDSR
jgi:hypothetical protein